MSELALTGGAPVFDKEHRWPRWPQASRADEARVLQVVRSGAWGIGCPVTREFADRFARSIGVRHALPVSTGTAALELTIKALGIGPGDEVIVPAYTFIATATCALQMGATVVFADIDPETLEIDPAQVARLITPRTRAIIPVHFGGNPCDMAALLKLAKGRKIAVIEDAAHAHGMIYRGRPGGAIGRAGCFSFQTTKNMASGEGGVLATNDETLFRLAESFHSFGRKPGRPWYEHHSISWNQRMTGLQAALLIGQLGRLESQTRRRLANGNYLNDALSQLPGQRPQRAGDRHPKTRRAYHLYIWRYGAQETGVPRSLFLEALRAEGVPASGGYLMPLQEHAMFVERRFWHHQFLGGGPRRKGEPDYARVETPVAKALCGDAVWLPQSLLLGTRGEMRGVVDAVAKVIANAEALRCLVKRRKGRR